MIQILIVDDNPTKQEKIKNTILDSHNVKETDIALADCIKEARRLLYRNNYDLMILDLVLPIEKTGECEANNGVNFLSEIQISPSINPPIHIVGLSGYKDQVLEFNADFKMKLWNLIEYEANTTAWQDQLNSIIFHLVKTRQRFLGASLSDKIDLLLAELEEHNLPNTFLGANWASVSENIIGVLEKSLEVPHKFSNGAKAKNINMETIKISNEYDFQNLVHLVLRPWIPSVEPENVAVVFDGNTKNADFSIKGNSVIIEAKYIDSTGKKNDTLKTLEGLKHFYKMNSNVRLLMFVILVESNVSIDKYKIESEYSQLVNEPLISVKVIENKISK
ncbi:MAG: response regulator [Urechidicola sp.]|nr:response regulator [Urechidicola sp.]